MRTIALVVTTTLVLTPFLLACHHDSAAGGSPPPDASSTREALCTSTGKTAYDSYQATLPAILASIVAASGAETQKGAASGIGGSFAKIGTPGFDTFEQAKQNIGDFLIRGWGGPDHYQGQSLEASHRDLAITSDQYDFFVSQIYIPALQQNGVPPEDLACFLVPVAGAPGTVGAKAKDDIVLK